VGLGQQAFGVIVRLFLFLGILLIAAPIANVSRQYAFCPADKPVIIFV